MTNTFSSLGLQPELLQAVTDLGFTEPTPIQLGVIPHMLHGRDVIGQAQTGTGKTAAFGLPLLQRLDPHSKEIQALVLAPTRELAQQVSQAIFELGQHLNVRPLAIYGGQSYTRQVGRIQKGVHVVVGTPGRMLDLIRQGKLDLSGVQTLVLDEADEMLSMGFIEDIEAILQETPTERQTSLFSATMPAEIRRLANKYMREPETVTIAKEQVTAATITQHYYLVNESDKLAVLTRLFEMEPLTNTLIFARTRLGTGELAHQLTQRGFPAEALNGDLSQDARDQVLRRFRQETVNVLVATDVAARGLDIDDISHVINYDLPRDVESYVHRVGRTGRGGKSGIALSLVTPGEQGRLRRIEKYTRQTITAVPIPSEQDILARREQELKTQMEVWLRRDRCQREKEIVGEWIEEGYDPILIAAAALKMARAEEKQRPIARISPIDPNARQTNERSSKNRQSPRDRNERSERAPRQSREGGRSYKSRGQRPAPIAHEKGMVRLVLNAGHSQGVRPGDVVRSIASTGNIPGRSLGAIEILPQQTYVDVPEQYVSNVLKQSGRYQIFEHKVEVEKASG